MITQEYLKARMTYNPKTGHFTLLPWIKRNHRVRKDGRLGSLRRHNHSSTLFYWVLTFGACKIYAHRLAWLYMTGDWPRDCVDHINGDGLDNRWCNLRECTKSQNQANRRLNCNNSSGHKGIRKQGNVWTARITIDHRETHIGSFATIDEAKDAYEKRLKLTHGKFARL